MTEKEFETYWKKHRNEILSEDSDYMHAKENFGMHNGANLILFGIPIVIGIVFMNNIHFKTEILTWAASAAVTIVAYAICVWIKALIFGVGSPDEVEQRIKQKKKEEMTGTDI